MSSEGSEPVWHGAVDPVLGAELVNRFSYHPPKGDQATRYEKLRATALELARMIAWLSPQSLEQALAFTHLETAIMWANAAIARRE